MATVKSLEEHIRNKERVADLGEVFTPDWVVKEMLALLSKKVWAEKDLICLEPTCGNGQFLIGLVQVKMDCGLSPEEAVNTTFGMDIMKDNIEEARLRVLEVVLDRLKKQKNGPQTERVERIAAIICHNIFKVKDSLEFMKKPGIFDEDTDCWENYPFFDEDVTSTSTVLNKEGRKKALEMGKELVKKARLVNESK